MHKNIFAVCLVSLLAAWGGGGSQPPFPVESAYDKPLGALPSGLNSDFALTISWNGQQTPNLEGVFSTRNAMDQTLLTDADAIIAEFPQ
jgi:hypothetical protein